MCFINNLNGRNTLNENSKLQMPLHLYFSRHFTLLVTASTTTFSLLGTFNDLGIVKYLDTLSNNCAPPTKTTQMKELSNRIIKSTNVASEQTDYLLRFVS